MRPTIPHFPGWHPASRRFLIFLMGGFLRHQAAHTAGILSSIFTWGNRGATPHSNHPGSSHHVFHLDFCSSHQTGLPASNLGPLQLILHTAVRDPFKT